MALYYNGDLKKDLEGIKTIIEVPILDEMGKAIGYGRCQQILQVSDIDKTVVFPEYQADYLKTIGHRLGCIEVQEILQILWAKRLHDQGFPTSGALGPR